MVVTNRRERSRARTHMCIRVYIFAEEIIKLRPDPAHRSIDLFNEQFSFEPMARQIIPPKRASSLTACFLLIATPRSKLYN